MLLVNDYSTYTHESLAGLHASMPQLRRPAQLSSAAWGSKFPAIGGVTSRGGLDSAHRLQLSWQPLASRWQAVLNHSY